MQHKNTKANTYSFFIYLNNEQRNSTTATTESPSSNREQPQPPGAWIQGEGGGWTHLEHYKAIRVLINTGQDPMENHKAPKPAFNGVSL